MNANVARPLVGVVDDDSLVRESVEALLRQEGFHVDTFESAETFLHRPRLEPPACLIVDLVLPGMSGLDLHQQLARAGMDVPIVLVTAHGDIPTSVRAMKAGALDFLTKPYDADDLLAAVRRAVSRRFPARLGGSANPNWGIMGEGEALQSVLRQIELVAETDTTVLITGETGTGKELVARAIHKASRRAARPLVCVNCAAIPQALVASELFGHEKGAFTGALQSRQGRFEQADGGTIFLDEVGELPPEMQVTLLRVLQERELERVGGSRAIKIDVRVIAATNRDLEDAVTQGEFRADLFYRLNVFPIEMPALRDRREDIPVLVEFFARRYSQRAGTRFRSIDKESLELLQAYDWPGNVRELQNVVERSMIVSDSATLSVEERWLSGKRRGPQAIAAWRPALRDPNHREEIEALLAQCHGRVSGPFGAAERLGVPASTLESRIRSLEIDKRRFKSSFQAAAR